MESEGVQVVALLVNVIGHLRLDVWVAEEGRDQTRACYFRLGIPETTGRG